MKTQLLCTFTTKAELQKVLQDIRETYVIVYNYIYILQNKADLDELYITYNINTEYRPTQPLRENGGVLDKSFIIDWQKFRNSIILTNTEGTKKIQTRIFEVIEFNQK